MNNTKQALIIIFIVGFSLVFLRLIQLQVAEGGKFGRLAVENAAKMVPESAPRGVIYDRFDKVVVENRPIFTVRVLPYILAKKPKPERERVLGLLGKLLGEKIEFKVSATEPIIVKDNVPLAVAVQVEENKLNLDGVVVSSRPVRLSKYGTFASHVLGYVGEIEARELERLKLNGYRLGDIIGKDGVEKNYDRQLRGEDGGKMIEVDVYGTPTRILESLDPVPGPDMKLTIDLSLQLAIEEILGGQEGAVVVLNARSGELLSLASYPNYNPNIFADSAENWKWQQLNYNKHPFINRALAIYPPGSIFKIVTLAAALEEGVATPDTIVNCPGYYKLNNRLAKCWLGRGHGSIGVVEGLVWSCDVVFYELGRRLGPDLIVKYARKFGLGSYTGIDLPQEKKGTVPTKEWKETYLKEPWYPGDSINYGIGQGFVQVTPLQMAMAYASLASGQLFRPYVVQEIKNKNGKVVYQGKKEVVGSVPLTKDNLALVRQALRDVVKRGTGVAARVQGLPAAGKTGTAENPGKAHAWFICYAPDDDPEIVIAVFIAHGEHGDQAAAYVARDVLKWYKEHRLGKEYPQEKFEQQYILNGRAKVPYRPKTNIQPPLIRDTGLPVDGGT